MKSVVWQDDQPSRSMKSQKIVTGFWNIVCPPEPKTIGVESDLPATAFSETPNQTPRGRSAPIEVRPETAASSRLVGLLQQFRPNVGLLQLL